MAMENNRADRGGGCRSGEDAGSGPGREDVEKKTSKTY